MASVLLIKIQIVSMTTKNKITLSDVILAVYLALVGIGAGVYNTPNTSALMTAVKPTDRGLVASLNVMLVNFMAMICITIVFKMILGSVPPDDLIVLFLYGGASVRTEVILVLVKNFNNAMWIGVGVLVIANILVFFYSNAPWNEEKKPEEVKLQEKKDIQNQ